MESKVYTDMSPAQRSTKDFNGLVSEVIADLEDTVVSLLDEFSTLRSIGLPNGWYQRKLAIQITDTSKAIKLLKETLQ